MEIEEKVDILLVDDQSNNLVALRAVLDGMALNLVEARSGEEALRRILDGDFAVILMDVQMPGMDGFEAAALIRERDRSSHTPIIFLTAFESSQNQVFKGYALGAVDYLSKPIIAAVLRSKVAVFVDLFRKTMQVKTQARQLLDNQRREHERGLAEEKRLWELARLREETAREREAAEAAALRADELARIVAERVKAEQQLRQRAAQQATVADLGQRALGGTDLDALLDDAARQAARELEVDFVAINELTPEADRLVLRAGVGWNLSAIPGLDFSADDSSLEAFTVMANQPIVVNDLDAETRFTAPPMLLAHGVVSGISVVIQGRNRPYGTLGVFCPRPRMFTRDDVHFLLSLSNVLASAIQRRRDDADLSAVRDELAVQLDEMTRLHGLVSRLTNTLELSAVLEEVIAAVTGMQGTDRGVLMLHDRDRDVMTTAASVGFSLDELNNDNDNDNDDNDDSAPPENAITAIISGGLVVENAASDPVLTPHLNAARRAGYLAVCSTPLLTGTGQLVGSIATYFPRPHQPSVRETRLIELYARQAAASIDNARLYRAIRDADHHKTEFLAMLAHELRNPLAPILNALYLLGLTETDAATAQQSRDVAEQQVRHLTRLVDDLLDVSRISNGKIQLRMETIDLIEVVRRSVQTARPTIEGSRHTLSVSLPEGSIRLLADSARIDQIFANLLNNAAKYTDPGGSIDLTVRREGDEVVAQVTDSGVGIAPELLPRVFDLFTQADRSLDRSQGGLGIGLTLVRRLVELHGGSVSAQSAGLGCGSAFTVRLPIAPAESLELARDPIPSRSIDPAAENRPKHVLVVDDNVAGARILARVLRANGHRAEVAHDGPTALDLASTDPPDVVLLDIGLPGMDGYEVARRIRQINGMQDAFLVALTGYGREDDRLQSREAGLDLHLVKPVDPHALTTLLSDHQPLPRLIPDAPDRLKND